MSFFPYLSVSRIQRNENALCEILPCRRFCILDSNYGQRVAMGGSARHHGVGSAPRDGSIGSPRRGVKSETPRRAASMVSVSAGSDHAWKPSSKVAQ